MDALTLNLDTVNRTDDQFYELCRRNQNFRFERTQTGELIVHPSKEKAAGETLTSSLIWASGIGKQGWDLSLVLPLFLNFQTERIGRPMPLGFSAIDGTL